MILQFSKYASNHALADLEATQFLKTNLVNRINPQPINYNISIEVTKAEVMPMDNNRYEVQVEGVVTSAKKDTPETTIQTNANQWLTEWNKLNSVKKVGNDSLDAAAIRDNLFAKE